MSTVQTDVSRSDDTTIRGQVLSVFVHHDDDNVPAAADVSTVNQRTIDDTDNYYDSDNELSDMWIGNDVSAEEEFNIIRIFGLFDNELQDDGAIIERYPARGFSIEYGGFFVDDAEEEEEVDEMEEDFIPRNLFLVVNQRREETVIINDECCICLEKLENDSTDMTNDKQISQIEDCHHGFCSDCLFNWLKQHNMCPVCRTPCVKINLCK